MTVHSKLACAASLTFLLSCGPPLNSADPYEGVADPGYQPTGAFQGTPYDSKFQPTATSVKDSNGATLCPSSKGPCYPLIKGYAHGSPIYFYEIGGVTTKIPFAPNCPGTPPAPICKDPTGNEVFSTTLAANRVFEFSPGQCTPNPNGYDVVWDAYDTTVQYPVMTQLPLAVSAFATPVVPMAAVVTVTGISGDQCNDIKNAASVDGAPCTSNSGCNSGVCTSTGFCQGGRFGATAPQAVDHYSMYAGIDMTASVPPLTGADGKTVLSPQPFAYAWSGDLQTGLLSSVGGKNGGNIPVDNSTPPNFVTMDGVIVDPVGKFSVPSTDSKTIIFPAAPGEAGWSPIVRLHDYTINPDAGQSIGSLNDICDGGGCTSPNQVDMGRTAAVAFNTIFVIAVGQ
jgi:hypothetical protein